MDVIKQIESEIKKLTARIQALEAARDALRGAPAGDSVKRGRKPGTKMSDSVRKKLSEAAKKRWAKERAKKKAAG